MRTLTEIRWHARAGQGAVTAAKLVADTALLDDAYIQAMPEYGPERTGAPLKAYTRISQEPIEIHNNITNPHVVVIVDDTLLGNPELTQGITDDGIIILNTVMSPAEAREKLNVADNIQVATIDASGIALDTIKRNIPNTPIVGALAKATGLIELEALKQRLVMSFGKKFSQEIIDANLESADRGYGEVELA
ncbi:MAG: 2-oxoacid:acceptor oxidoreductase family protein [Eggerthellaceae bacterium]|nr:2-oxoacid:acceptor oxidoreductase family protein [Eggerthellaceae bacterium]